MKRVLNESTKTRGNMLASPRSAKKMKLNGSFKESNGTSLKAPNGQTAFGSSQPKSQFEDELEKLTQEINDLKEKNSERDQEWARPALDDFDEKKDSLCFQQIEAEEGTLNGGRTTVKLFGVTEVGESSLQGGNCRLTICSHRLAILFSCTLPISTITSTLLLRLDSVRTTVSLSRHISRRVWISISLQYTLSV
jgi:hypothetical protein